MDGLSHFGSVCSGSIIDPLTVISSSYIRISSVVNMEVTEIREWNREGTLRIQLESFVRLGGTIGRGS